MVILLWNDYFRCGALAGLAGDDNVGIAHLFKTVFYIFHADVRTSVVFLFIHVKADAVVRHNDLKRGFRLSCGDRERTAAALFAQTVLDGVFRERLDAQLRQQKVGCLNIVRDFQLLSEPQLFDV